MPDRDLPGPAALGDIMALFIGIALALAVWLFGRLQSGPFFALLRKTDATRVAGS